MNEVLDPSFKLPRRSRSLPCNRLPFGIHQRVCNDLDSNPGRWQVLAARIAELGYWEVNSQVVKTFEESTSPTTKLLDYICEDVDNAMTIGELMEELMDEFVQLSEYLQDYLEGRISEDECRRYPGICILNEDLRRKV